MMKSTILVLAMVIFALGNSAHGSGLGVLTQPLSLKKKVITGEVVGIMSNGKGIGMQARYKQEISRKVNFDFGIGANEGERASRFFAGFDFELYPDYQNQPRLSLRPQLIRSKDFDLTRTTLSVAPVLTKGFNFWGKEAHPFIALPIGVSLEGDTNTYETNMQLAVGITGRIPVKGYSHLMANIELDVNIKDSFTALFTGISYPFD